MKKTKTSIIIGIIVFVVVAGIAIWNPLQTVQWKISDLFFRSRGASDLITIIAIDNKSLSQEAGLGRFKDWPRSYYSQLLRTIDKNQPKVVAFDLDFREQSRGVSALRLQQLLREYERLSSSGGNFNWYELLKKFEPSEVSSAPITHPDDVDFQKAINESAASVVLTSTLTFSEKAKEGSLEFPQYKDSIWPIFSGENISIGYKNAIADRDGILRRFMPWVEKDIPSFSVAIADAFWGAGKPAVADSKLKQTLINYAVKPFSFRTISFVDALSGSYNAEDISGKIILVGATAPILQDLYVTPASRSEMPGVEINANIVQQILEIKSSKEQGNFSLFLVLVLLTVGIAFIFLTTSLKIGLIIFAAVLVGWPALAWATYQSGTVLNVVYPEIAVIFTAIASLWYRNQTEFREKRMIKKMFAHYVSPIIVNELVKNPASLKLGGKRQQISVLFSDIVGFTSLAEKLSPEDTVALLNDYLTAMTEVIFEYHGTLDKYQGDAIMALFGAPLDDENHAVNACHAALGMRKALVALHEKWNLLPSLPFKDRLTKLDFRVGIATGPAVIGNIGSQKRFDYTAIGDIVNLGSRLESVNRKYGTHIIVDKNTFVAITENHSPFAFRKLDTVRVKGKEQESEIFEVIALAENVTSDTKSMLDDFENGRILYTQRNFAEAKQYFESALSRISGDAPSQIYKNRCAFYIRKPPSLDWNPVVNLEEK